MRETTKQTILRGVGTIIGMILLYMLASFLWNNITYGMESRELAGNIVEIEDKIDSNSERWIAIDKQIKDLQKMQEELKLANDKLRGDKVEAEKAYYKFLGLDMEKDQLQK